MKLTVKEILGIEETEVIIKCRVKDETIDKLVNMISTFDITIIGKKNNINHLLKLEDIYYFEAVDNRVFAYDKKEVYEVSYKIQEISELFEHSTFIQTSRTVILNIKKIEKVSTLVNGRILAYLDNGEKTIITRVYAQMFKRKLRE